MKNDSVTVDILGSCVSRVVLLGGDISKRGTINENINIRYFLDKHNIVCCMLQAPFTREEVESIQAEELWDSSRLRSLKQSLNKYTIPMLLSGESDFLIIDLYELMTDVAFFDKTMFSTTCHEFFNTKLYKEKYIGKVGTINFMNINSFLWYGYIDLFFEKIISKYDSDKIILNRIRSSSHYITKDGYIQEIPQQFLKPFHANYKYNEQLSEIEDYIINKYNISVIDFSKYFIVDEKLWTNLNGVHYQKMFYEQSLIALEDIILNNSKQKYYNKLTCKCISDILMIDFDNDLEYLKYFRQIDSPFNACDILDSICLKFTEDEVINNRQFISALYLAAHKNKDILEDDTVSNEFKINKIIGSIPSYDIKNEFDRLFIKFISNYYRDNVMESAKYLFSVFLELLNQGDCRWINLLEKIESILPNDKTIIFYKLQYLKAIEDYVNIELYSLKLKNALEII